MAKKPDLALIAAMKPAGGESTPSGDEPMAGGDMSEPHDDNVSEEELGFAQDMGFDRKQAAALKSFIRSCMQSEEEGEYGNGPESEPAGGEQGGEGEMGNA